MNLILRTDSYKLTHWNQYPPDTEAVYSYLEARPGATFPETVFFGLQSILKTMAGSVVTADDVQEALALAEVHFGAALFNFDGWMHIVDEHDGMLPLRIKAVPEGSVIPVGNVMMTVENTCPECFWLTNAMESLLTHVWYPSTVATLSRDIKLVIADYLDRTAETRDALPFMLHDFGYRGATSDEAAAIGGAGHLINFLGTDTLVAMELAMRDYGAHAKDLAFSVPATEHSVMTALGHEGEYKVVDQLLNEYPSGILSVVGDSYDIYGFVDQVCSTFKERILARNGVFVVRPDSVTQQHVVPASLTLCIVQALWDAYGGVTNSKGYRVLDPHVRVLWGDGIDENGIEKILSLLAFNTFSAENMVFGMGGGLLQKVNRDTQRFAFKSSAQKRGGQWHAICKEPLDSSKRSKRGRLRLALRESGEYATLGVKEIPPFDQAKLDVLSTVFVDGQLSEPQTFEDIRKRAAI